MQLFNKIQIKKYIFVLSFFIASFIFIFLVSLINRDSKDELFKNTISSVLQAFDDDRFIIGEQINFNQPINNSICLYKLTDQSVLNEPVFAALVRITGFCGAQPCVLLINTTYNHVTFLGIAGLSVQTYNNPLMYGITDSMLEYWKKNIINILETGGHI